MPRRTPSARRDTAAAPVARRSGTRLSRDAIVAAAIDRADREGLDGLSMRRLATDLDVDPMSIYHHLRDKAALLSAMADAVLGPLETWRPAADRPWQAQLRELMMMARAAVTAHPWSAEILSDQSDVSPTVLRHLDRVLGVLRGGGCSLDLAHHALHLLGSRMLGFTQDLFDDRGSGDSANEPTAQQLAEWARALPHIAELASTAGHDGPLGGCDDDEEFAFSVDLMLDGLERRRLAEAR